MKYDFKGLPQRIKTSREGYGNGAGMSRETLGKMAGDLSRQAVARWEQPYGRDRNSVPDLETLRRIADALRVDFLWLLTGHRYIEDLEGARGVLVPVYSLEDFHEKTALLFYRRTLADVSEDASGFLAGGMMNAPEYMPHDIAVVEPCREPQPRKMMVGRLIEKRMNLFGQCVISGFGVGGAPVFDLVPLNEGYPRISSKAEAIDLLAVAVEHQKDLRGR